MQPLQPLKLLLVEVAARRFPARATKTDQLRVTTGVTWLQGRSGPFIEE
jgi:hypothetical protein